MYGAYLVFTEQMLKIASDTGTPCSAPVLVILGEQNGRAKISAYVHRVGSLLSLDAAPEDDDSLVRPGVYGIVLDSMANGSLATASERKG